MRRFFAIFLWLPYCASGGGVYHIQSLSERELLKTYIVILREASAFADSDWKTSAFDPAAGFWGDGVSSGNEGIRTVAGLTLADATLVKYDNGLSAAARQKLLDKAIAGIRYATATHLTGPHKCPDGQKWGNTQKGGASSWQSGLWTGTLGFGAWLIWDHLDPALQKDLERVIASECDALKEPPNNLWLDTKAEENAWEIPCLALGDLMFPDHPHAAAWHEKTEAYMMNTLCTSNDMHDSTLVDGRPMSQWVRGANVQPDFTLENHNIFHPSYVGCSSYFLTEAAMYYTFGGRPVPQAASHHLIDTWRMFQTIILPSGEAAFPQGMDWELHGLPFLNLFASLATHDQDPLAARLESENLQYMRAWQNMRQGSLAPPGSRLGITRHSICAEQAAFGFLAHKIFGPAADELSAHKAMVKNEGVWERPYLEFISHRTDKKFASFSWKNRVMGLIVPIAGHEEEPFFTVPIANGMVGSFDLSPSGDVKTTVVEHSWKKTDDGFETEGVLLLNGGRLKQTLKIISHGPQTVVYEDTVAAVSNVTVRAERGLPIGIENDEISGGTRTVTTASQRLIFDYKKPGTLEHLAGTWANVDGRLGVEIAEGSGLAYVPASGYSPGISVCTDILYGSFSDQTREFKAGEIIAHRRAIFSVEVTPKETASLR